VTSAVALPGPSPPRLPRQTPEPVHEASYRFRFGKADVLRPGHDVTVLATGGTVWYALEAAKALASEGIQAEVINVATVKPLDEETILRSAGRTGHVLTVED